MYMDSISKLLASKTTLLALRMISYETQTAHMHRALADLRKEGRNSIARYYTIFDVDD